MRPSSGSTCDARSGDESRRAGRFHRSRRHLLCLSLAAGAFAASAQATPSVPPIQQPPVHILVMGDSLGEGVWGSLYRRFVHSRAIRIVNAATASTGFNRTPYEERVHDTLRRHPIDLLVMMTGANDAQDALGLDGGLSAHFGTDAWRDLYARRLQRFLDPVHGQGLSLVWIGLPVMRSPAFEARIARVRDIHQNVCAEYLVPYIDPRVETCDDAGAFASHKRDDKGRLRLLRADDGVHFADFGNDLIGGLVLRHIAERWPAWVTPHVV